MKNFLILIFNFQESKFALKKFEYNFDKELTNFTATVKLEKPSGVLITVFSKALRDLDHLIVN